MRFKPLVWSQRSARPGHCASQARERRGAVTRFMEPARVICPVCRSSLRPFGPACFHVKLRWSGRPGFSYLTSSPFADEALRSRRRHFHRSPAEMNPSTSCFRPMLRPRAPATALACSVRWPHSLAISWAFPALYSVIWAGREPARPALTCLFPGPGFWI